MFRASNPYSKTALLCLLLLCLTRPVFAQDDRWQQLKARLGQLYGRGQYSEALPVAREALQVAESTYGPDNRRVATALSYLAAIHFKQGRYAEAEPLYLRVLKIEEKALGPEHRDMALPLNLLAELYREQGRYAEAEPLYRRALRILENTVGPEHSFVATVLTHLGHLQMERGRYPEAELIYQRALVITEKARGPEDPAVATSLNSLAQAYFARGKFAETEPLLQRALRIYEKAYGPEHPDLAFSLRFLARVYRQEGKDDQAQQLYERAIVIQEKALGREHPHLALTLQSLAGLYLTQGKQTQAEALLQRALRIEEKALGPEHPTVADTLVSLATLYQVQGDYNQAEPLLQRALHIGEKARGMQHPAVARTLGQLANLRYAQDLPERAAPLYDRQLGMLREAFGYNFKYLNESDRLTLADRLLGVLPLQFSFYLRYARRMPELTGRMYDLVLWEKGLTARSMAAMRAKIAASGDPRTLELLEKVAQRKTQLATLQNAQPQDREVWKRQIAELKQQADELEKELVMRSSALQEETRFETVTWRDVQAVLKPGEAAVEIVSFPFHDGKNFTGMYTVALVVRPESKLPELVVLDYGRPPGTPAPQVPSGSAASQSGATEDMPIRKVDAALEDYRRLIGSDAPSGAGREFYQVFWQPLEEALGDSRTLYFSPDGSLNKVALGIVPAPDGKLLMERYDLRMVNNTGDLLRPSEVTFAKMAVLLGNPKFLLTGEEHKKAIAALGGQQKPAGGEPVLLASAASQNPMSEAWSRDLAERNADCPGRPAGGVLCPLPSTAQEISEIGAVLGQTGWIVETYHDEQALEEAVKSARHPRVLHLATHGFFLPDPQEKQPAAPRGEPSSGMEDPMLRSGLLLAGADRILKQEAPLPNTDDGVFTAYEVSALDLRGTELVVLSACETGLSRVRAGGSGGTFGLRRALQIAGAEAVLMSMWKVPDRETQELMTSFYQKWLAGKEKHEALRQAQLEERAVVQKRYGKDLSYYWGAFVLVGR